MVTRTAPQRAVGWWAIRAALLVMPLVAGLAIGYAAAPPARPWLGPALAAAVPLGIAYALVMPPWRFLVHRWETTDEVANGLVVAWWLGRVAHQRLAVRLPETFTRLRYGWAVSATAGAVADSTGWLDRLERDAVGTNQERRPVGS